MTVFLCDGFEAYGNKLDGGSDIESRISGTNRHTFQEVSGGHGGGNVSLIDDLNGEGLALEFPDFQSGRAEYVRYEHPDGTGRHPDYQVSTNASVPVFCVGFRMYNAAYTATGLVQTTIFSPMNGSVSSAATLRVDTDKTTLVFVDNDGNSYNASTEMSPSTWHYIEVEWKQTTIGNGGYAKVYLDGNEVIDTGAADLAGFTFFSTFGFRIGLGTSGANQTSGENYAFDDVYCMEIDGVEHTAPLGACRVFAYRPSSDDTPNDWSPSTGSDNFAMIDEDGWDTTDYVEAATSGNDDHYGLTADISPSIATIHAARIDVACAATDGSPELTIGFDDGTADEENLGTISTGAASNVMEVFEIDPSGAAWTESNFNSIEATQRMTE